MVALIALGLLLRETAIGGILGLVALTGVAAAVVLRVSRSEQSLSIILGTAFVLRILVAILDQGLSLLPKADQLGYHAGATAIAEAWHRGTTSGIPWDTSVGAYTHVLAPLYYVFGPDPLLPRFLSALLGLGATFAIYHIARALAERRAGLVSAGIYAGFPTIVYIQSETLRDPLVHLLILGAFALCAAGLPRHPGAVVGASLAVAALYFLRLPTFLVIMLPIALLVLTQMVRPRNLPETESSPTGRARHQTRIGPVPILAGILIVGIVGVWFGVPYLSMLDDLSSLTHYRSAWATGGSAYLTDWTFNSPLDVLLFLPLGALYFLFTPFPWQIHNGFAVAAFAQNLLIAYPIAVLAVWGFAHKGRQNNVRILALYLLLGALLYGLIEGNVGTAIRHRQQFDWVFIVMASPVLLHTWDEAPFLERIRQALAPRTRPEATSSQ